MCLKFKQIFSLLAVLMISSVLFNVSWQENRGLVVPQAQAVNVWGDWFDQTVGQKSFNDVGFGRKDPRAIIANVVNIAFGLLGVVAIILIMYGGFVWMTAAGNDEKITTAKAILKNASIGLLIVLSTFALAIYVLSRLLLATTGNKTGPGTGSNDGIGLGALGGGIIRSVYPAPQQQDVPRNTAIIVTFREVMDANSICDTVVNGFCAVEAKIKPDSVKIYKTDQGDNISTNLNETRVTSSDNKTFVFVPNAYLGSPSEKIWYSVALTEKIAKASGASAFSLGEFQWKFEVSNKLDLTPPQVLSAGIWPAPDNARDTIGSVKDAVQARGSITVKGVPQIAVANSVAYTASGNSVAINISDARDNLCDGQMDVSINSDLTASVAYNNMPGKVDAPQTNIINRTIATACGFKIILNLGYQAGHSWVLTLVTQKSADYLLVGGNRYAFVGASPKTGEILIDNNLNNLAANIRNALAGDANVSTEASGTTVTVTARVAGRSGNSLALLSSADYSAISINAMSGGSDKANVISVADRPDKPKNAIIQINFNEAVNPLTIAGPAKSVASFIRVVNLNDGSSLDGEFVLSNQYQTVEFLPANECGVNGCGDKIYCLPEDSNLQVELVAAALNAACATDADCAAKIPFNSCSDGICTDSKTQAKYPEGQAGSGIADLANNSLDGNRDTLVRGPVSWFDANLNNVSEGDNFRWSFWISDQLDLGAPTIVATAAGQGDNSVDLDKPIKVTFDKLMLSSSLVSGSIEVAKGNQRITHKLINLWSVAQEPTGYWLGKEDKETSTPPDQEPDITAAIIRHSQFSRSSIYRAQVGSGVKDIYQNCYKPSSGPDCVADQNNTSCCLGVPGQTNDEGNCP